MSCLLVALCLFVGQVGAQEATPLPLKSVPLGGIGAGVIHILPNGNFGRATLTHNPMYPLEALPGSLSALWIRQVERAEAVVLARENAYHLPNVAQMGYQGLFPEAIFDYGFALAPLEVRCRAFSPFIPHDVRNSSFPAFASVYEIRNRSNTTLEISLAFSWENILGVGGTERTGALHQRAGTGVVSLPAEEGFFGLRFLGAPLASGNSLEERLRDNLMGDMTLLVQPPKEGKVSTATWNTLDSQPGWWEAFRTTGEVRGSVGLGEEGKTHPGGVLAVRFTLKPNAFVAIPFALAWKMPRHYTLSGIDYGTYADRQFPDSLRTAQSLLMDWRSLLALSEEWQKRVLASNLPNWLEQYLLRSVGVLATHSLHGREGDFALLDSVGEGQTADFASLHRSLAVSGVLATLFPTLSVANLERLALTQSEDGALHRFTGNAEFGYALAGSQGRLLEPLDVEANRENTVAYLLLLAQHLQLTEDTNPLRFHLPRVRRALAYLKSLPTAPQKRSAESAFLYAIALQVGESLSALGERGVSVDQIESIRAGLRVGSTSPKALAESLLSILDGKPEIGIAQVYALAHRKEGVYDSSAEIGTAWYLLSALTGFGYSPYTQQVRLTPRIPGTWRTLTAPIFMPNYWGRMEFKPRASGFLLNFRLDRMMPVDRSMKIVRAKGQLQIASVRVPRPEGHDIATLNILVSVGQSVLGVQKVEPEGSELVITLDSPLALGVGDRFEVAIR